LHSLVQRNDLNSKASSSFRDPLGLSGRGDLGPSLLSDSSTDVMSSSRLPASILASGRVVSMLSKKILNAAVMGAASSMPGMPPACPRR